MDVLGIVERWKDMGKLVLEEVHQQFTMLKGPVNGEVMDIYGSPLMCHCGSGYRGTRVVLHLRAWIGRGLIM